MNINTLATLSTGDVVENIITGKTSIIGVLSMPDVNMVSIYDLLPLKDYTLTKSRLIITKEELARIKAYHKAITEQMKNQKG